MSENPLLTLAVFLLVPLLTLLLWKPGEPPVLLFAIGMQWLQVAMLVLYADILQVSVETRSTSDYLTEAIGYSLLGLVVLAAGMRLAQGRWIARDHNEPLLARWSMQKVWKTYLTAFVIGILFQSVAFRYSQLTQILLVLFNIKWVVFFALAFLVAYRREGYLLLLTAIVLEVLIGFTGFFSGYKQVFFVLIIAFLSARPRLKRSEVLLVGVMGLVLVFMSLFWTSIKMDYRDYVSQGSGKQVVARSFAERVTWMSGALTDLNSKKLIDSMDDFAERVAYVEYFSWVLRHVPRAVPYEDGKLWGGAVVHILTPRLIFPGKEDLLSDTKKTAKYTGLNLGRRVNTSISTGYMAESYIDFGFPLMYVPIFLLGLLLGGIYRFFMSRRTDYLVNAGSAMVVLLGAIYFETNIAKMLGGTIMAFIVMALLLKYVVPVIEPKFYRRRVRV
ncbi:MAG: hypothetical protein LJE74_00180 [Proteobacteria bacterium]|nr:hypothetical protein [Pseudomonadota bacterium]